jgi:hypothetical protein
VSPRRDVDVVQCSPEAARQLTEQICKSLDQAINLIKEAFERRAWAALGYKTWADYCKSEFGTLTVKLTGEARRKAVAELTSGEQPMSNRAAATALGVDHKTVAADRRATGEYSPVAPDDAETANRAPVQQSSRKVAVVREWQEQQRRAESVDTDIVDAEVVEDADDRREQVKRMITGADGKLRSVPAPKPRRDALADDSTREAAERTARSELYTGMAKALSVVGAYGGYEDIPKLMDEYDPAELYPPEMDRYFSDSNLADALHFITELIEWKSGKLRSAPAPKPRTYSRQSVAQRLQYVTSHAAGLIFAAQEIPELDTLVGLVTQEQAREMISDTSRAIRGFKRIQRLLEECAAGRTPTEDDAV